MNRANSIHLIGVNPLWYDIGRPDLGWVWRVAGPGSEKGVQRLAGRYSSWPLPQLAARSGVDGLVPGTKNVGTEPSVGELRRPSNCQA